jgi:hypothetical protein
MPVQALTTVVVNDENTPRPIVDDKRSFPQEVTLEIRVRNTGGSPAGLCLPGEDPLAVPDIIPNDSLWHTIHSPWPSGLRFAVPEGATTSLTLRVTW